MKYFIFTYFFMFTFYGCAVRKSQQSSTQNTCTLPILQIPDRLIDSAPTWKTTPESQGHEQ